MAGSRAREVSPPIMCSPFDPLNLAMELDKEATDRNAAGSKRVPGPWLRRLGEGLRRVQTGPSCCPKRRPSGIKTVTTVPIGRGAYTAGEAGHSDPRTPRRDRPGLAWPAEIRRGSRTNRHGGLTAALGRPPLGLAKLLWGGGLRATASRRAVLTAGQRS